MIVNRADNSKNRKQIGISVAERRFRKRLKRKKKHQRVNGIARHMDSSPSYGEVIEHICQKKGLPKKTKPSLNGTSRSERKMLHIPEVFSLIENYGESFNFINKVFDILYFSKYKSVSFDYSTCKKIDLSAQVYLDIVLKNFIKYFHSRTKNGQSNRIKRIQSDISDNPEIEKFLFSVGSPATIINQTKRFSDIIPYKLKIGNRDNPKSAENKEVETTELVDYIIRCLNRLGKDLNAEQRRNFSQVIGEILSNAEDHSTTKYRFSIGFFKECDDDGEHFGVINLVIFNFGQTIYEKFKDPNCPTKDTVRQMEELSSHYTERSLFKINSFSEETLWTLYALQEGVTSNANYRKRGNGSIRFIDSFFNLGSNSFSSNGKKSKLLILSGNTRIEFEGSYKIKEIESDEHTYKVMTFNKEGDIRKLPDRKFVQTTKEYFPGTMISTNIFLKKQDLIDSKKT